MKTCCVCGKPATHEGYSSAMYDAGQKPRPACDAHDHTHAEWAWGGHAYGCPCGRCDGTGDPIGAVKVLGAFHEQPDGSFRETEEKDKS